MKKTSKTFQFKRFFILFLLLYRVQIVSSRTKKAIMEITVDPAILTLIHIYQGKVYTYPLHQCNWPNNANIEDRVRTTTNDNYHNVVPSAIATRVSKRKFAKMSTVSRHLKPTRSLIIRAPPTFRIPEPELEIKTEPDWFAN